MLSRLGRRLSLRTLGRRFYGTERLQHPTVPVPLQQRSFSTRPIVEGNSTITVPFASATLRRLPWPREEDYWRSVLEDRVRRGATLLSPKIDTVIHGVCQEIAPDPVRATELHDQFTQHTTHLFGDEELDVTPLMDKYQIEPHELFHSMWRNGVPSASGLLQYRPEMEDTFTLEDAERVLENHDHYIGWYQGKAFKTRFRRDQDGIQILPRRRFDNRTYYTCTYRSVLTLLDSRLTAEMKKLKEMTS